MILVADSGSSKTDWILSLPGAKRLAFRTPGINPYFLSEKDIVKIFHQVAEIQPYADKVKEIYFFGAGCSSPDKHEVVSNGLSAFFKKAFVSVDNDMIGCAYATCGEYKGLTCILGTGSNIAFFDGKDIYQSNHGLGFILGDEGSGTYLGKKLLTDYLYGRMPDNLKKLFIKSHKVDKETVIQHVYMMPSANLYLASFARFLSEQRGNKYIDGLLYQSFDDFIKTCVLTYPKHQEFACHFVGSIAFHFKDILSQACKDNGVQVGKILKHPIDELFQFILKREKAG
ncbi:MAG: N-acetylglucosamine kinase [Sphingobacteriaceae bacterium]|jgi:N-acetylglucosamine kinase-like BadF-type ATPase|nr:N-acetylglucosamine kinase [Sphingobacteriaceae bacterium]